MAGDGPYSTGVPGSPLGQSEGCKLSDILNAIANDERRERISVADLMEAMQHRAVGALLFMFAAPNLLPSPPGTSIIVGVPLALLSAQLMLGRRAWLPKAIAARSMTRQDFGAVVSRIAPWLTKAERRLKPRLSIAVQPPAERAIGAVCLVLSAILFLPIPLGNVLPAFAICLFSLGLVERDGVWVAAAAAAAVAAIAIVSGVLYALTQAALFVWARALK